MAQTKTPYGLVYNDDGSLCVTYRDDDVPFQGVRSFAVETATTNLVNVYTLHANSGVNTVSTIERIDTPFGMKDVVKIMKTGTGSLFRRKNLYSPVSGEAVAITLFVKPINGLSQIIIAQNFGPIKSYTFSTGDGYIKYGWHKITHKFVSGNVNSIDLWLDKYDYSEEGNQGCYVISQVESGKRYCTSYVDESRPKAEWYIEASDIEAEENRLKNHVISFWFKVQESYDEEYNTLQDYSNWMIVGTRRGGMWDVPTGWQLGVLNSTNAFINGFESVGRLIFVFRDEVNPFPVLLAEKGTFENKWNHIIITKVEANDTEEMKVYLNGKLKVTRIAGNCASRYSGVVENLLFCNDTNTPYYTQRSHLISNLYIGKYKRDDGTVIWTNDYIREVYENQIPFTNPPAISIY